MPEISRFYGIVIKMYADDHNPPHFHAECAEYRATFSIETGQMIQGDFPNTKSALVIAWAIIHKDELLKNWVLLAEGILPKKIKKLD